MKSIVEANSSVDRIRVNLTACDALVCELEDALSRVEAHFGPETAQMVDHGTYRI